LSSVPLDNPCIGGLPCFVFLHARPAPPFFFISRLPTSRRPLVRHASRAASAGGSSSRRHGRCDVACPAPLCRCICSTRPAIAVRGGACGQRLPLRSGWVARNQRTLLCPLFRAHLRKVDAGKARTDLKPLVVVRRTGIHKTLLPGWLALTDLSLFEENGGSPGANRTQPL
jgi:hypothetical protein